MSAFKDALIDVFAVAGYAMMFVGLWMVKPEAALIGGGAVLLVIGLISAWISGRD